MEEAETWRRAGLEWLPAMICGCWVASTPLTLSRSQEPTGNSCWGNKGIHRRMGIWRQPLYTSPPRMLRRIYSWKKSSSEGYLWDTISSSLHSSLHTDHYQQRHNQGLKNTTFSIHLFLMFLDQIKNAPSPESRAIIDGNVITSSKRKVDTINEQWWVRSVYTVVLLCYFYLQPMSRVRGWEIRLRGNPIQGKQEAKRSRAVRK